MARHARRSIVWFVALPILGLAQDADPDEGTMTEEQLVAIVRSAVERGSRTPSVLSGVGRHSPAAVRSVARRVRQTRLSVSFTKWQVEEVLDFVRTATGLNCIVTAKARKALEEEKPTVVLTVTNLPLEDILSLIITQIGDYRFTIRSGAIVLLRKEEYRPRRIQRVYDVRDILYKRPDFSAPALGVSLRAPDE